MKNIFIMLLAAAFILGGCSDPVSVGSNPAPVNSVSKEVIKIPVDKSLSSEASFSVTEIIDGSKGGKIKLNKFYFSFGGEIVTVNADVKFPPGAFSGKEKITLEVNTDEASVVFSPHMNFQKDVTLNLSYAGININSVSGKPGFVFLDDNGNVEEVTNEGVFAANFGGVNSLVVKNAKLKHFSRYAFVKGPEGGE